jgi:YD repeat-containing protein
MCALSVAACSKQPPVEQPPADDPVVDEKETKYLEAYDKLEKGEYVAAYELFVGLGDYKDAAKEAARFRYVPVSCVGRYSGEGAMSNETTTVTLNENNLPEKCFISYDDGTTHTCTYTYNENGKLTSIFCTDPEGELEMFEAVYRADGKLEKETYRYFSGNHYTTEYTYDDRGYKTKVVETYPDGWRTMRTYFYDDNGNVIKTEEESNGNVFSKEYVYDSNNRRTKVIERDADGNISWTDDYLYNEQGKLLKITCTENGEVTDITEYTYDEKGRLLSDVYQDPTDGYVHSNEYIYTADGRTEKLLVKMPGVFEDAQDLSHKLVYVPFEYTDDEWDNIVRMY